MTAAAVHVEEWRDSCADISDIEDALAGLRARTDAAIEGPEIRTSVCTHIAWVPLEWLDAAHATLEGLAERLPSRAILLVPATEVGGKGMTAHVSVMSFPLPGADRHIYTELIQLTLRGARALAPGSIVTPLLISDLPVFLRWRGRPDFGSQEFEQLAQATDRLVVDSREWPDGPGAYPELAERFDLVAVSDIAWRRTLPWRRRLAERWPEISELEEIRVAGPLADARLLAGWLRSRLDRSLQLVHDEADEVEVVAVDGRAVEPPRGDPPGPGDLLSEEFEQLGRDPVYEAAVRSAGPR